MSPRRLRVVSPALGAACLIFLVAPAYSEAQARSNVSKADPLRGAFVIAGGTDALVRDGSQWTPSAALHFGYEKQFGRRGLAWRSGVDLWTQGHRDRKGFVNGTPAETLGRSGRSWMYGASLYGTWGRGAVAARVRPYLLGGAGVHRSTSVQRGTPRPGSGFPGAPSVDVARTSFSTTGGAGLQADLGLIALFTEARYTRLLGAGLGTSGGGLPRNWLMPLTVGVRLPRR